ncbi:ABC-type sugar transport system, permease component [Flexilinea flocculi]|uniref:ABC-type sugar transport system, permease component n=2 Tax=Flexilinea flocculi TaxID=1678840 RepID=A0A0S7BUF3_9CHLR|nr:ABC-type sugar transport system, permease component [Flexilinea flocculi]
MSLPTVIILAFLTVFPLGYTIYYSFTNFNMLKPKTLKFIGLSNFEKILADSYFQQALLNTLKFMVLAVILETGIGLLVALLVNSLTKDQKIIRTLLLLPVVLPPVTVALIWRIMLSNNYGIINKLLELIGIAPVSWLNDVRTAFYCILVIDVWQYMPFAFLLIYASLQSVPESQYEAAQIDGANAFHRFWYITIPNIMGGIVLVILLRSIDSIRLFDKVNILTRGGPANTTATITQYIYNYGVGNYRIGFSSAGAIVMTLIVLLISSLYVKRAFQRN